MTKIDYLIWSSRLLRWVRPGFKNLVSIRLTNFLALRAEVRPAIHERDTLNGGATPRAWFALLTIGVEAVGKVARLSIDVDVLLIKAGPALL